MRKRSVIRLAAGITALGGATFAYASLLERNMFTLRRVDVPVLEPDAEPLRILHISDLHMMPEQRRKQEWVAALGGTDPDLVVRTSGEYRLSNFLLWEAAYSELVFTDVLWPDFRREHLFDAVREYQARDRRFGGLSE